MKDLSPWRIRRLAQSEDVQPEYSEVSPPGEVHLADLGKILIKRRRIILILFLLNFGFGLYFALSTTNLYTATATIKIEPRNPQVTEIGAVEPPAGNDFYDYHETQFALMKSRRLIASVIKDLGLGSNTRFTNMRINSPNPLGRIKSWLNFIGGYFSSFVAPLFQSVTIADGNIVSEALTQSGQDNVELNVESWLIDSYSGLLEIVPVRKTRLVRVEFTTPDSTLSQALANAHAQGYLRLSFENRFNLTKEAREFLDQKANDLRMKLEQSELAASQFRREHGVVSVEKGENIVVNRLVDLNKELTVARAQRIEAESLHRTVENKKYQDLAEIMKQGLVLQLKGNLAALEGEKNRLSTIFKAEHPRIQELSQQITAARVALNNEIANVVKGIQSSYAAALAKERGLQTEADKQQKDALKLKELGVDYAVLQAEVNANRSVYESVLKRLNETNVSNDVSISNIQIVERAGKPEAPSSPNTPLFIFGSMSLGLLFGIGVALLQEYFDSTVSTPEIVQRSLGLNTFGVVPHFKFLSKGHNGKNRSQIDISRAERENSELITNHNSLSILSESYRTIRTSLLLALADRPPQIVLLTSAASGEGKTTTAVNLSIALAQNGFSVLVLDADLRRGHCHTRLGLQNNRGLSDVLKGCLSVHEAIQRTSINGLSLLSRGMVTSNPTELLDSLTMREMLKELRQSYKFILIDSPPVVIVNDAAIVSVASDGVLLVIDGQHTSKPTAQRALERLEVVRSPLLGVILNRVNLDDPHYSYYRAYNSYHENKINNGESVNESMAHGFTKSIHRFNAINRIARIWSSQANQHAQYSTKRAATNGSIKGCREETFESAATLRILADKDRNVNSETAVTQVADATTHRSPQNNLGAEIVPQQSLDQLIESLGKSLGPTASLIVREQVANLGESFFAFPKQRMGELLRLIQRKITQRSVTFL